MKKIAGFLLTFGVLACFAGVGMIEKSTAGAAPVLIAGAAALAVSGLLWEIVERRELEQEEQNR